MLSNHLLDYSLGGTFTRYGPGASKLHPQPGSASAALGEMCHDIVRNKPALAAALRAAGLLDRFVDLPDTDDEAEQEEGEAGDDAGDVADEDAAVAVVAASAPAASAVAGTPVLGA